MKVPTKAFLVTQTGYPHYHRVGVLAVGEEAKCRRLATQLVLGIVQISEKLDLHYRYQTALAHADAKPENALLVEQGIDNTLRAELGLQPLGDAIDSAFAANIFASHDQVWITLHQSL